MRTYKIYVNGDLIAVEAFTSEEVRELNNCEEIRLELVKTSTY